jgi:excisionase family DNA binding protein
VAWSRQITYGVLADAPEAGKIAQRLPLLKLVNCVLTMESRRLILQLCQQIPSSPAVFPQPPTTSLRRQDNVFHSRASYSKIICDIVNIEQMCYNKNPEDSMNQEAMLTITEVARYLQVVPLTVYRAIDRGDLRAVKVGRVWRIRREDLQAYLDRSSSHPRGEEAMQ